MKENVELRSHAKRSGVYLWQLADALNISVETLNRKLRHKLPEKDCDDMLKLIDQLSKKKGD